MIVLLVGYRHNPFQHCPQGELHKKGKCWCNPKENFGMSRLEPSGALNVVQRLILMLLLQTMNGTAV